jgi:broad specificity phosphatase PhoE
MTMLSFVRHGAHVQQDQVLVGRADVPLSAKGREQAERVAERLRHERVDVLQSSPRQRTRETADCIAARLGKVVEIAPALDEVDTGNWAGRSFAELAADPEWQHWNAVRSTARAPHGESMLDVQVRITRHIESVCARHPDGSVVLVTHGDVIRSAVLYYLGISVDLYSRIQIDTGSLTTLLVGSWGAKLTLLNEMGAT